MKKKQIVSTPPRATLVQEEQSSTVSARLPTLLLFVLSVLIYSNTLWNEYAVDDTLVLTENKFTLQGIAGIKDLMTRDAFEGYFGEHGSKLVSGGRYRPLSLVTFALEYSVYGLKPAYSHLINILLFALTVVLLYRLLRSVFPVRAGPFYLQLAFVASFLFALHPIHTEAVANIKGRDEIMGLLFSLATFWAMWNAVVFRKWIWIPVGALLYFLALLSKENAITFLAVVPLGLYFFSTARVKDYAAVLGAMALPAVVFLWMRHSFTEAGLVAESPEILNNPFVYATAVQRYATTFLTFLYYLKLLVIPHPLTHDYYFNQIPYVDFSSPKVWMSLLINGALLVWALLQLRAPGIAAATPHPDTKWRERSNSEKPGLLAPEAKREAPVQKIWSFSILYYFITFSVVSNVLFTVGVLMNERFVYMSSVGFCLALASVLLHEKVLGRQPKAIPVVLLVVALLYGGKTFNRNFAWKNNLVLFSTDVLVSPNSAKVQTSVGGDLIAEADKQTDSLKRKAMLVESVEHLQKALSIYPTHSNAMLLLGNALYKLNKNPAEVIPIYTEANRIRGGGFYDALYNLGCVYAEAKQPAAAVPLFRAAQALKSDKFECVFNLGDCYLQSGKGDSAILWLNVARGLKPESGLVYYKMGTAYGKLLGNLPEAIRYLERAVALSPNEMVYREDLGVAYGLNKQYPEAIRVATEALRLQPNFLPALMNLSVSYRMMGDVQKADSIFAQVQRLTGQLPQ